MPVTNEPITLDRETDVVEIPSGIQNKLPAGTVVRVLQSLGNTYTVYSDYGLMYRIDAKDADALGLADKPRPEAASEPSEPFSEKMVWDELKTVYDPEIPVNIADLGLIYSCQIKDLDTGGHRIDIEMSIPPGARRACRNRPDFSWDSISESRSARNVPVTLLK